MRTMKGFSLFELVVSLTIIAILMGVALHYFSDMPREARIAKLQTARASVLAAANLVHNAYWVRRGQPDLQVCSSSKKIADNKKYICSENGLIAIVNGYPQALMPEKGVGIIAVSGLSESFSPSRAELLAAGYSFAGGGDQANSQLFIQLYDSPDPSRCRFSYQPASTKQGGPAVISPLLTEGC